MLNAVLGDPLSLLLALVAPGLAVQSERLAAFALRLVAVVFSTWASIWLGRRLIECEAPGVRTSWRRMLARHSRNGRCHALRRGIAPHRSPSASVVTLATMLRHITACAAPHGACRESLPARGMPHGPGTRPQPQWRQAAHSCIVSSGVFGGCPQHLRH